MTDGDDRKQGGENAQSGRQRYLRRLDDDYRPGQDWRRGPVPLTDLLPKLVDPIYARKGLASSALAAAWPDLAGTAFADCTMVEAIQWPHQRRDGGPSYRGGVLTVRVDGPKTIYLQHEERQILERVNRFFGFAAIGRLKIVQAPVSRAKKPPAAALAELTPQQDRRLRDCVAEFSDPRLNEAILDIGRGVLRRALSGK